MIIGISGLAGSGKDTIGKILVEDFGYTRLSLATKVKDVAADLFDWNRQDLEGLDEKSRYWRENFVDPVHNITPRKAMQKIGQGLKEVLDPQLWSNIIKNQIIKKELKNVVITDVRFIDEMNMIRGLGGIIIRVERGVLPQWFLDLETAYDNYSNESSERNANLYMLALVAANKQGIDKTEYSFVGPDKPALIIKNEGTLEEFQNLTRKKLTTFLEQYK